MDIIAKQSKKCFEKGQGAVNAYTKRSARMF